MTKFKLYFLNKRTFIYAKEFELSIIGIQSASKEIDLWHRGDRFNDCSINCEHVILKNLGSFDGEYIMNEKINYNDEPIDVKLKYGSFRID